MISSSRRRGFCPRPLKSPDPDHHNRSVIVCTKSPQFRNPSPSPPRQPTLSSFQPQLSQLRLQNRLLKQQLQDLKRNEPSRRIPTEFSRLSELSKSREIEIERERMELERSASRRREMEESEALYARQLMEKEREINKLTKMFRTVQTEGDQQRINEVEEENRRLKKMLDSRADALLEEQNLILINKVEELMGENQAYRDMISIHRESDSELVRELKQKQKELKQELTRERQEYRNTPGTVSAEAVDKIKQNFEKQVQRCRDRFYELGEQLSQAESRLERAEKEVAELKVRLLEKHRRQGSTAIPLSKSKKHDMSPSLARGDSGFFEHYDDDIPQISKFSSESRSKRQETVPTTKPNIPQKSYLQELLKLMKEKDTELERFRTSNRVLDQKANILKKQLDEQSRFSSPSKDREIEQLKKQIKELRKYIQINRGTTELTNEINGLKSYIQSINATLAEQRRIISSLRQQNDRLRQTLSSSHGQALSKSTEQVALLRRQNTELKHHIEQLQQYRPSTIRLPKVSETNQLEILKQAIESLKEENRELVRKDRRKADQLEELLSELARAKELLQSVSIEEVESRIKLISQQERDRFRNKEKVIKISLSQKESLRRQYQTLKNKVVTLSDNLITLTHQNTILKAQISRLAQQTTLSNTKSSELSALIQAYINTQHQSKSTQSELDHILEAEITRQLRELQHPIDLSNLKVSLEHMGKSIEQIQEKLQLLVQTDTPL